MKKFKLSWSILNQWSSGNRDGAIKMLAGISIPETPPMKRGKRLHDLAAKNKIQLNGGEISNEAIYEDIEPDKGVWINYFRVPVFDWLDLSLVVDVLDIKNKLIVDWKASVRRSSEHNKLQIYIYALAMEKMGNNIDYGVFGTINESDDIVYCEEYSMFRITEDKLELAENYIETIGGEIYSFLQESK